MDGRRWERYGAIAGIAFVMLAVIAGSATGSAIPMPDDPDQVFKDFFVDRRTQLITQAWLYGLSAPLLLWFAASLRRVLRGDDGHGYLPDLLLDARVVPRHLDRDAAIPRIAPAPPNPRA